MADIRQQLLAAFAGEHAEHVAAIRAQLTTAETGGQADLRDIFRRAHSLKGAARAVELPAVEADAHALETLLAEVERAHTALDRPTIAEVRRLLDAIEDGAGVEEPPAEGSAGPRVEPEARHRVAGIAGDNVERLARSLQALRAGLEGGGADDDGLRAVMQDIRSIRRGLDRPQVDLAALRAGLDRAAAELGRLARTGAQGRWFVNRAAAELERDAERIMLVPAATVADGYERMVRELAADTGKEAVLVVASDDAEADRRVLQALRDPLLHALRNAVSHGIEPPAARRAAGKPAQGRVTLNIRAARGELLVEIADDGGGLDRARIEAAARGRGLIAREERAPPGDALFQLLFEQGLSTAESVDRLSGRGVGLSVVADAVRRLHGTVRIAPAPGGGTRLALSVPLTLARQAVLLLEAGGGTYGVPARAVERLLRLSPGDVTRNEGAPLTLVDGEALPVVALAPLLDMTAAPPGAQHQAALVLATGETRLVMLVDALIEVRVLVVGEPTSIAAHAPLVYGTATLDGEGIALVLAPEALAERSARDRRRLAAASLPAIAEVAPTARRTILVVDDSITTRTLEKTILEAQGYAVLQSVDGLDGLERLRGSEPIDLVIADVEMPRMDGFALLAAIRNDPALKTLPVVMMTSRDNPDDVRRGLELGADAYVTKQGFDQGTLLATIGQLI